MPNFIPRLIGTKDLASFHLSNWFDLARYTRRRWKNPAIILRFLLASVVVFIYKLAIILLKIVIGTFYFLYFFIFWLLSFLVKLLTQPFSKRLHIPASAQKIDGISFVIPTWNKKEMVLTCVKLLDAICQKECSDLPKEIIVIENGSTDGSGEALLNLPTKTKLRVCQMPTNVGFARGINYGAKQARYNYLYLMNNDMEAQVGLIKNIIALAREKLRAGQVFFGISSQIFFFDPKARREESGKTYTNYDFGFLQVAHCVNENSLLENSPTIYPGGGSSLINKEAFLALGGYDHRAYKPLYTEDLDLGFVAWKKGLPSFFCPASTIIHHHRSSTKQLSTDPTFIMKKNFLVFLLKNITSLTLSVHQYIAYFLLMYKEKVYCSYMIAILFNSPNIFISKFKTYCYRDVYSDKKLINFADFVYHFYEK